MTARHPDPHIDSLYAKRRTAAELANTPGFVGIDGWAELERIETLLQGIDPDGDWRYECDRFDGRGWRIERPEHLHA